MTTKTMTTQAMTTKTKTRPSKGWVVETAKSGRATCRACKQLIGKDELRIGVVTFRPHRHCSWHHFGACSMRALVGADVSKMWGLKDLDEPDTVKTTLKNQLQTIGVSVAVVPVAQGITGSLDIGRFASALTERYNRFRSFTFGLPEDAKYTTNWNWRCFLSTMFVCNTKETAMLLCMDSFFKAYPTPEKLKALEGDRRTQKAWMDWMERRDMRHVGKKIAFVLRANKRILEDHKGEIPDDREKLEAMNGVGRHVASITMAWVHEKPEFGIDVHVSRILKRWGYVDEGMTDEEVEMKVKATIPEKQIGHFSRAFVDHGQQVCGFTPDCEACYLKSSCPAAAKYLDW